MLCYYITITRVSSAGLYSLECVQSFLGINILIQINHDEILLITPETHFFFTCTRIICSITPFNQFCIFAVVFETLLLLINYLNVELTCLLLFSIKKKIHL